MICPRCSKENIPGVRRCVACGFDAFTSQQDRPLVSMDGTITPPVASQNSATSVPVKPIQIIPRLRTDSVFGSWRKNPTGQAVSVIAALLLVGGMIALLGDKNSETSPTSESVSTIPESSIDVGAPNNNIVSGVDIVASIVQVVTGDGDQDCWGGSGTIFLDDKHVLTNNHIIESDESCAVKEIFIETVARIDKAPLRTHSAIVVAIDKAADLAILEISPITTYTRQLVPVRVAEKIDIGAPITAIGFPAIGGSSVTVTVGEISGFSNYLGIQWIKSSISISGGNSGGGAFDSEGGLVGIPSFLGVADAENSTDCRSERDTNGDGAIDENDQCVSMGGFINSLSPATRALELARTNQLIPSN